MQLITRNRLEPIASLCPRQEKAAYLRRRLHHCRKATVGRRNFLALASAFASSVALSDQVYALAGPETRRVAMIMGVSSDDKDAQQRVSVFRAALKELGWVEGQNVAINLRWASSNASVALQCVDELLNWKPDVFLAHNTIVVGALTKRQVSTPTVFVSVFDPIGSGFIKNMAQPGENITGFVNHSFSMAAKWMELLVEIRPGLKRVTLLWSPATAPYGEDFYNSTFLQSAPGLGLTSAAAPLYSPSELESTIDKLDPTSDGLTVMADPFTTINRRKIINRVLQNRIVTVYPWAYFVRDGGLISYGVDQADMFRRSASYVDRILRGERAGDLPVQAPTEFELGLNLKTATALGLEIPLSLRVLANEVIE